MTLKKQKKRQACIKLLNIILDNLIRWFAPILSFTTEEIFKLISKNKKSIHLESFGKNSESFHNKEVDEKWNELKK